MLAVSSQDVRKRAVLQTSYAGLHACGTLCEGATHTSMAWVVRLHAKILDCDVLPYRVLLTEVASLPYICHMAFLFMDFASHDSIHRADSDFQSCCVLQHVTA